MSAVVPGSYNTLDDRQAQPSPAPSSAPRLGPSRLVVQLGQAAPLAITAALVGSPIPPRPVQINVTGLTIGLPYVVTASAAGWSRVVQGGEGIATATQLILIDVATPLNAALTYKVTHAGLTVATSGAVTVAYAGDAVLQSLDGSTVAGFAWMDNADPRAQEPRVAMYRPAGRSRPIMHYDVAGDESGTIVAETASADTIAMRELIRAGAPVLVRAEVGLRDLDAVEVLGIRSAPRQLIGAVGTLREWTLAYTLVADADSTVLVIATFDSINRYYAGKTLADVNTQWAGQTLADINAFDWIGAL